MNLPLSAPPKQNSSAAEWQQWFERLWRFVRSSVSTSADADAAIPSGSTYHGVTALSAPRTLTLPDATKLTDGDQLIVQNETANASNITLSATAGQAVNGAATVVFSGSRARRTLIKRGVGWFSA